MILFSMRLRTLALAASLGPAFVPLHSLAAGPAPAVEDPGAAVPALRYHSVFEGRAGGVEQGTLAWRDAHAAVGQFPRGHADLVKWEARQAASATPPGPEKTPDSGAAHDHSTRGKP